MAELDFFRDLLSTDKDVRAGAEKRYADAQKTQPLGLSMALCRISEKCDQVADRHLALVLLRQTLKLDWAPAAKEESKFLIGSGLVTLLGAPGNEEDHRLAIQAFVAMPGPILRGFTEQALQLAAQGSLTSVMFMESYAEFAYSPAIVQPFGTILSQALESQNIRAQLLAIKAAVMLVLAANETEQGVAVQEFACKIPSRAIRIVARAVSENFDDQGMIESSMESLVSLAETCGWALDATLGENCAMLLDVCENRSVSPSIRALSMTVFGSVMARKGSSASKDAPFANRVIRCILQLQVEDEEFESDFNEDTCPDEDDILGFAQSGPRCAALDALSQLAHGSAGNTADANNLLSVILAQIKPLLSSPDWKARVAALSTLASIAAPLEKSLKAFVPDLVNGNRTLMCDDPSARVRLTAAGCLCALLEGSRKIGKEMRKSMHQTIVGGVCQAIAKNDSRDPIATRCAVLLLLTRFYGGTSRKTEMEQAENGDQEEEEVTVVVPKQSVLPYLDGLVSILVGVLQRSNSPVIQERAMEALTAIGTQARLDFGKYYPALVPGIKSALQQTNEANVRMAAMILIATCAETVDKTTFAQDATEVVGWLLQRFQQQQQGMLASTTKDESSELQGLFHFCERVAAVLGPEFAPFMPHILPLACRAATADLGVSVVDNASSSNDLFEQDEASGQAKVVTKLRGVGNLEISANIYAFQVRESALTLIDALAESGCIRPEHLQDCTNALLPNISDRTCTAGLNVAAAEAAASIFNASCESDDPTIPTRVLVALGTPIMAALAYDSPTPFSSDEIERRASFAGEFERMTRICYHKGGKVKPPMELLPHIVQVLMNAISGSFARRTSWHEDLKSKGFEPDTLQAFGEEIVQGEVDLTSDLVDSLGYLLKTDREGMWPHFQSLVLPFMVGFLDVSAHLDVNLAHNALCCFTDALEFGPQDSRVEQACVPNLKKALFSSDSKLRQVGAYGLGVCAQKITLTNDWVEDVVQALVRCLKVKDAKEAGMVLATENVISAVGKFFVRTGNENLRDLFVQNLPIMNDKYEAEFCHALLFRLVLSNAVKKEFAPQVLFTCAAILQNKDDDGELDLCDEPTFQQLPQVKAQMRSVIGDQEMLGIISRLPSDIIDDETKGQLIQL